MTPIAPLQRFKALTACALVPAHHLPKISAGITEAPNVVYEEKTGVVKTRRMAKRRR